MGKDSTAILAEIEEHRNAVRAAAEANDVEKAKYESGVADTLQAMLPEIFAAEKAEAVNKGIADLKVLDGGKAKNVRTETMMDLAFGAEDSFKDKIEDVLRMGTFSASIEQAIDLPTPVTIEQDFPTAAGVPSGVFGTLGRGECDGNMIAFSQPAPGTNRFLLPVWHKGERKQEFSEMWKSASAYVDTVAGIMVVSEETLKDYPQLQTVLRTDLFTAYETSQHYYALLGAPAEGQTGIVGLLNPAAGVPRFNKESFEGDNIFDSIKRMVTRTMLGGGHMPTHIGIHPLLREQMDLMKVGEGRNDYIGISMGGRVWNIPLVDDPYLADFDDEGKATNAYVMVYDSGSATWYTQRGHGPQLVIDRMGYQLAYNEISMRLEATHLLKIADPLGFMLCSFNVQEADVDLKNYMAPRPRPNGLRVEYYVEHYGINAVELGDFALSGKTLYGEANLVTVPEYSKTAKDNEGYFVSIAAPVGTKVQKDSEAEKEITDGFVLAKIGDKASGITAKKLKFTMPDKSVVEVAVKVQKASGRTTRQGGRVTA